MLLIILSLMVWPMAITLSGLYCKSYIVSIRYGILPYSLRPGKSEDPEVSEPKGDDSEAQVMKEVSR